MVKNIPIIACFLIFLFSHQCYGNKNIGSLKKQLETSSYAKQLEIYNQLINAYGTINLDSSLYFHDEVFLLTKKSQDYENMWDATNTLLDILNTKGEYELSKRYLDHSLEIMQQQGDNNLIGNVLLQFGIFNWKISNLKEAQSNLNESLIYAQNAKNLKLKANILKVFGSMSFDIGPNAVGLGYLEESYNIFQKINDTLGQANLLNNIGYVHIINNDFELALKNLNLGLTFRHKKELQNINALMLANKGDALIGLGEEKLGFKNINDALLMAEANQHLFNLIICYEIKTRRLLEFGKYDEVIEASKKGVELCKGTGTIKNVNRFYKKIAKAYQAKNNFKQSLFWTEKANKSKDELLKIQKNEEVIKLQMQFQIQQKETEKQILLLKNKNQKIFIALLIATFLAISFLIFYFSRKKQKKQIEVFRQKIAADLHDDVGGNLNSISRLAKGLKSADNSNEINQGIDILLDKSNIAIKNVIDVIWALDPEENRLEYLIEKMEETLDVIKRNNKNIGISFDKENINQEKTLSLDVRHHLLMIFKEALNNIQKHSKSSSIIIKLKNSSDKLEMEITNYFEPKNITSNSTGRGILKIKKRVEEMKGLINIKESENNFSLYIELNTL